MSRAKELLKGLNEGMVSIKKQKDIGDDLETIAANFLTDVLNNNIRLKYDADKAEGILELDYGTIPFTTGSENVNFKFGKGTLSLKDQKEKFLKLLVDIERLN